MLDKEKTTKYTLKGVLILFVVFLVGAAIFYFVKIGALPIFTDNRVDNDGHHEELVIPEDVFNDIEILEGSIEELVQSGQVGQEVKLAPSDTGEQIIIEDQNQFTDDIKKIENRFENLQDVIAEEEKNPEPVDFVVGIEDEIEGPDNIFEFNPL